MKKNIIFLFLAGILLQAMSCGNKEQTKTEEAGHDDAPAEEITNPILEITQFQFQTAGIEIGNMEKKGLSETIRSTGKIDIPPQNYAEVSTYVGAVVKSILAIEGDFVKKGQVVMTLEHPDLLKLQEEYITIKSNLQFLEKEYERQKELYDQKVSSGKIYQEAEAKYRAEKGRLSSLQSQLQMLSISTNELDQGNITRVISLRAPVEGYIGHIRASIGAYIDPNKVLFDVINLDDVHLHLSVFEKDISKVRVGQKVYATIPNRNNEEIEATVFKIGKLIDDNTKAIDVHADIRNKHDGLIPGLFVNANINVSDKEVPAVPQDAVVRSGEKQYVFIVTEPICEKPAAKDSLQKKSTGSKEPDDCCKPKKDGGLPELTYKMVEVKTGASAGGYVEIQPIEVIPAGTRIVVKGAYYLISQLKSNETVGCCAPGEEEAKK